MSYFITKDEQLNYNCLVIESKWDNKYLKIIKKNDISVLRLSLSAGWSDDNIDFLKDVNGLKGIEIYSTDIKDLSILEKYKDLEILSLQCNMKKAPNFSIFNKLKVCKLKWSPKTSGITSCVNLLHLNITNYPYTNFENLKCLINIEELLITSRKLESAFGLENMKKLKNLDLYGCTKLSNISDITNNPSLFKLEIESCKYIKTFSVLSSLKKLKEIILIDCGKINSLKELEKCHDLETVILTGDTNIIDKELKFLNNMPILKNIVLSSRLKKLL